MSTADDHRYMAQAIRLAGKGLYTTDPNPRVGCVLVQGQEVVGEGWHVRAGAGHAEVHALQAAADRAKGATAYVTLEPCVMCAGAIVHARVARVVFGAFDPKAGAAGSVYDVLSEPRLNHQLELTGGVLQGACVSQLQRFFRARRKSWQKRELGPVGQGDA